MSAAVAVAAGTASGDGEDTIQNPTRQSATNRAMVAVEKSDDRCF
jgi:hypothetical protein